MKSEDIREVATAQTGRDLKGALENFNGNPEFFTALVGLEIAAQLAELNEKLSRVIGQVGPTTDGIFTCNLGGSK